MSACEAFVGARPRLPSSKDNQHKKKKTKKMSKSNQRVIGLDVHPDSFAGAIVAGRDPGSARVVSTSRRVELPELEPWAGRHTTKEDVLVLEASGNAFAVAERLRALGRKVEILDSHQAGKIGKAYCANDRVDAIKIARIYLSGLSPLVWQPDPATRERREVFSAYQGVVKEATRGRGRGAQTLRRRPAPPARPRHRRARAARHPRDQAGQIRHRAGLARDQATGLRKQSRLHRTEALPFKKLSLNQRMGNHGSPNPSSKGNRKTPYAKLNLQTTLDLTTCLHRLVRRWSMKVIVRVRKGSGGYQDVARVASDTSGRSLQLEDR